MSQPIAVKLEVIGDKQWCKVYFDDGSVWVPALHDLWRILYLIGVAEDRKYGWPQRNVKGADMVWESCKKAVLTGYDETAIREICEEYMMGANYKSRIYEDLTTGKKKLF